jgi:hypothetical protein
MLSRKDLMNIRQINATVETFFVYAAMTNALTVTAMIVADNLGITDPEVAMTFNLWVYRAYHLLG